MTNGDEREKGEHGEVKRQRKGRSRGQARDKRASHLFSRDNKMTPILSIPITPTANNSTWGNTK